MLRVLIVDDQEEVRSLLIRLLAEDFEIITAENGRVGLAQLMENRVDAVVLDLEMPQVDGTEFMRALRAHGCSYPVLVCSGRLDIERRAMSIGASDWIAKPFGAEALRSKLELMLAPPSAGVNKDSHAARPPAETQQPARS